MKKSSPSFSPYPWTFRIVLYAFIIFSSLIIYGYQYPSSQMLLEIPPIMSVVNPDLYTQDLFVQENILFTPRYYYQHLIALLTYLQLNLSLSHLFYYALAFASFILGLYALGKRFGQSQLSAVSLPFLALTVSGGTVGYVSIFRSEPIPAVLAMGLAVWGFYFCFCQRWTLGYFFFGLASLIHILIGILPDFLMIPLLLLEAKEKKDLKILILPLVVFVGLVSAIYLPMTLTGSTGTGQLSNKQFVYLYGYIRAPHHFIPSAFAPKEWRNFFLFMLGGILCITRANSLTLADKKRLIIVICTSFVALLLGYIFVELYPLALVTKLQFARTTPFALLMVLMAISVLINEYYRQKNYTLCVLLLITPIITNGAIFFFLTALGLVLFRPVEQVNFLHSRITTGIVLITLLILLAFYPPPASISEAFYQVFWTVFLFLIFALPWLLEEFLGHDRRIKLLTYGLFLGSLTFFSLGLLKLLPESLLSFFQSRIQVVEPIQSIDTITKIAIEFRDRTDREALILIPPSLSQFRLYSQRAVVFDLRSFPFTDKGINDWENRMQAILGPINKPLSWRNVDEFYQHRQASELVAAARKFGANYILTKTDWHSDLKGRVFAQQGKWIIYQIDRHQTEIKTPNLPHNSAANGK